MKRIILRLLVVCQLGFAKWVNAQDQLLWKVQKPGVAKNGWLMGTIHQFPEGVLQLDSNISTLLGQSSGLVTEINYDTWMMARMLLIPKGERTSITGGEMTDEARKSLHSFFVGRGLVKEEDFQKLLRKTKRQSLESLSYAAWGLEKTIGGMEKILENRAIQYSKPISGLDSDLREIYGWYSYYDALQQTSWETTHDTLVGKAFDEYANLFVAYGIQDSSYFISLKDRISFKDNLQLAELRNINWMKKLPKLFNMGKFVAVGAAHLYGTYGLITLLRQAGYVVTPISTNFRGEKFWGFMKQYSSIYELQ